TFGSEEGRAVLHRVRVFPAARAVRGERELLQPVPAGGDAAAGRAGGAYGPGAADRADLQAAELRRRAGQAAADDPGVSREHVTDGRGGRQGAGGGGAAEAGGERGDRVHVVS